jgi:hypothetical protein
MAALLANAFKPHTDACRGALAGSPPLEKC